MKRRRALVAGFAVAGTAGVAISLGATTVSAAPTAPAHSRQSGPMAAAFATAALSTAANPAPGTPRFNSSDELVSSQDLALAGTGEAGDYGFVQDYGPRDPSPFEQVTAINPAPDYSVGGHARSASWDADTVFD